MMPYPIFIPYHSGGSSDLNNYLYPHLVEIFMGVAVFLMLAGLIGFLINILLVIVIDFDMIDSAFAKIVLSALIVGGILLIIGVIFMALTGVPIEQGGGV